MVRLVVAVALVAVAVVLWRRTVREVPERYRTIVDIGEVVTLVVLVLMLVALAAQNMRSPGPWDFPVFWTVGRNVVLGSSFYDPAELLPTYTALQEAYGVGDDWLGEFGFWYAPPTALVLAAVGLPSYTAGLGVLYASQFGFLAATVWLLHRFFPIRPGAMGLVEIGILVAAFRPVADAVSLAQIVFGAMFAVAVALATIRDRPVVAGVALGVGALFKHLLLIPAVLALALGKIRTAVAGVVTVLIAAVVAALVFGASVYDEWTSFGPTDRPATLALSPEIESLNGFLRRLFDAVPSGSGALDAILYPPYIIVAGAMTLVTLVVVWRSRSVPGAVTTGFGLIVVLSAIVYPNTLFNTLPILVPVMVVMAWSSGSLQSPTWVTFAVLVASYGLLLTRGIPGIVAMVVLWSFLTAELVRAASRSGVPDHAEVAT